MAQGGFVRNSARVATPVRWASLSAAPTSGRGATRLRLPRPPQLSAAGDRSPTAVIDLPRSIIDHGGVRGRACRGVVATTDAPRRPHGYRIRRDEPPPEIQREEETDERDRHDEERWSLARIRPVRGRGHDRVLCESFGVSAKACGAD